MNKSLVKHKMKTSISKWNRPEFTSSILIIISNFQIIILKLVVHDIENNLKLYIMLNGKLFTIIERCEFDFEYLNRTLLCLFLLCLSPSLICKIHILNSWDGLWCLTQLSTVFQLYRGDQFHWWRKLEHPHFELSIRIYSSRSIDSIVVIKSQ